MIYPKTREEWFVTIDGLVRKNLVNWDVKGDLPLPGVRVCVYGWYNRKYDAIAEIAEANWSAYCARHGYALRTYPGLYRGSAGHIVDGDQDKFAMYYDIRGIFDIVMYLDIDSLFVDMSQSIERCVDAFYWPDTLEKPIPEKPFCWTYDDNGPNSSLLIARTDERTQRHLRYAYEYAKANDNVRHGKIESGGMSDQDAMTLLMNRPPFRDTLGNCHDARRIGLAFSEADVTPQTWIRTYAGMSFEEKLAAMKRQVAHA